MSQKRAKKTNKRSKQKIQRTNRAQVEFLPTYLRDNSGLLNRDGFVLSNTWYHGTSTELLPSILENGLLVSGDEKLNAYVKYEMESRGGSYRENREPIYLSPSKEIAYYWANQTAQSRGRLFGGSDKPVVLEVNLPEHLNFDVCPDKKGYSMIISQEDDCLKLLKKKYRLKKFTLPLAKNDNEIISIAGLAHINTSIPADYISMLV